MDVATRSRFRGESPAETVRRLPSWLLSVVVHGLLYLLLMAFIRPVAPRGAGEGEFRTIGITTRADPAESASGTDHSDSPPTTSSENQEISSAAAPGEVVEPPPVEDQPPIPLDIPRRQTTDTGTTAPDVAAPVPTAGVGARELTRPRGSANPRKSAGGSSGGSGPTGPASVSFFGGGGQPGTRFAFVLDASASMYENNSIQVAKTELQASLLQVEEEQEFQIIFYNEDLHSMPTTGQRTSMFRGTEANRNRAAQHIRSVQPSGGTRHKEALLEALRLKPDVIFFLTDAGEPWMTAADLGDIRKRNSGRCRICVVEFGKGSPLSNTDSYWTKRLARENDGTYSYHDVNQFRRR
jgi:hypothetical protein